MFRTYEPPPIESDASEHPTVDVLRQVFWDLEKLANEDLPEIHDTDTLRGRLLVIRDKAKNGLISTPTQVTPIIQAILPKLGAAIILMLEVGDDGTALSLLLELQKQLIPSLGNVG